MGFRPAVELILAVLPDAEAIYLFGSKARDDARSDSDVDLAVLGTARTDPMSRFELQERIAARLHTAVDLVDLRVHRR